MKIWSETNKMPQTSEKPRKMKKKSWVIWSYFGFKVLNLEVQLIASRSITTPPSDQGCWWWYPRQGSIARLGPGFGYLYLGLGLRLNHNWLWKPVSLLNQSWAKHFWTLSQISTVHYYSCQSNYGLELGWLIYL